MMSYQDFNAEDFAADLSFQAWVQRTDDTAVLFWEQWAAARPEKEEVLRQATGMVRSLRFRTADIDPADMAAIKAGIDSVLDAHEHKKSQGARVRKLLIATAAAAAIIAVIFLLRGPRPEAQMLVTRTGYGETKTIKLQDGTEVWLNANSSLRYSANWEKDHIRTVELQGEAYFQVTHAPKGLHPRFVVHTRLTDVEVTGTAFNVYYRRDSAAIALAEGSVIAAQRKMKPGDLLQQNTHGISLTQSPADRFTAWMDQRVVIRDGTLETVALRMEEIFGKQIRFARPQLKSLPFTGSAPLASPELLMKAVCTVHGLKMREENNTIIFE